jgi:DNA-binding transcriptional MerR regulator
MPTESRYTIDELADLAGVTVRTVRYYVSQGLLPVDVTPGPGPKYGDGELARLRLIKRLQREHLPLAEIRRRLEDLPNDEIERLVADEPGPPPDSALDYIRRVTAPVRAAESPALYRMSISQVPPPPASPSAAPREHRMERSQWERVELAPDIELHVRRPLPRAVGKQVDRLIVIARELLGEDQS